MGYQFKGLFFKGRLYKEGKKVKKSGESREGGWRNKSSVEFLMCGDSEGLNFDPKYDLKLENCAAAQGEGFTRAR